MSAQQQYWELVVRGLDVDSPTTVIIMIVFVSSVNLVNQFVF